VETIVGVSLDGGFGHLLMYGLAASPSKFSGRGVGRHADRDTDADRMIESSREQDARGFRGAPPADVPALKELMLRVSQLVGDFPELAEMDLNPVRVLAAGKAPSRSRAHQAGGRKAAIPGGPLLTPLPRRREDARGAPLQRQALSVRRLLSRRGGSLGFP